MLEIYTSQYGYSGPSRLDITAKGSHIFGPTWDIVQKYKNGRITQDIYSAYYYAQMLESKYNNPKPWDNLLKLDRIVLVCYCPSGEFCHRTLLSNYLVQMGGHYNGEIPTNYNF